jgi:hypothetical protein
MYDARSSRVRAKGFARVMFKQRGVPTVQSAKKRTPTKVGGAEVERDVHQKDEVHDQVDYHQGVGDRILPFTMPTASELCTQYDVVVLQACSVVSALQRKLAARVQCLICPFASIVSEPLVY